VATMDANARDVMVANFMEEHFFVFYRVEEERRRIFTMMY